MDKMHQLLFKFILQGKRTSTHSPKCICLSTKLFKSRHAEKAEVKAPGRSKHNTAI